MSDRNDDDELISALAIATALYDDGDDARAYVVALGGVTQYFLRTRHAIGPEEASWNS